MDTASENLPVAFAALLAGGLLLEHGLSTLKPVFTGTSTPSSATSPSSSSAAGGPLPSGGQTHGLVSTAALTQVGSGHGWTGSQISDWFSLIISESNGTLTDTNPSSGAYGIAQGITGPSWYAAHGGDATTLSGQLTAMANYIAQRYGNPSAAWAFHKTHGWY